ncbi:hypothetical protein AB0230_05080 [Microbacterium sp. NPDC089190]|uniref:hypothetical protein n=1 Tax=Microbacterium sp. NPDC089190 TaxID=3155063 RepID=UPI003450FAD4
MSKALVLGERSKRPLSEVARFVVAPTGIVDSTWFDLEERYDECEISPRRFFHTPTSLRTDHGLSRGLGTTQQRVLEQLRDLNVGAGVLPGDNGGNTRRAAHTLAKRGLVSIEYLSVYGRRRLVVRLMRTRA